jgi:hypothetical protein
MRYGRCVTVAPHVEAVDRKLDPRFSSVVEAKGNLQDIALAIVPDALDGNGIVERRRLGRRLDFLLVDKCIKRPYAGGKECDHFDNVAQGRPRVFNEADSPRFLLGHPNLYG